MKDVELPQSRYMQYVGYLLTHTGMTEIQVAQHFSVSRETIVRAVQWARQEGVMSAGTKEGVIDAIRELDKLIAKLKNQFEMGAKNNKWRMDISERLIEGNIENSPVVNIPILDLKGIAAVAAQVKSAIELKAKLQGLLDRSTRDTNTQIIININQEDLKL